MKTDQSNLTAEPTWGAVEVYVWRRGHRPDFDVTLDLMKCAQDFTIDREEIDTNQALVFRAIGTAGGGESVGFAFKGADDAVHWVSVDTRSLSFEIWPLSQTVPLGPRNKEARDDIGRFFEANGGEVDFGASEQPKLAQILVDGTQGAFQLSVNDMSVLDRYVILSRNTGSAQAAACFAPDELVVSQDGMRPVSDVEPGCWLRTRNDGWQPLLWAAPDDDGDGRSRYLGTARGIVVSPTSEPDRLLFFTPGLASADAARIGGLLAA